MASEKVIAQRIQEFGDLHFVEDGKDNWNVNVGGNEPYVLIRKDPKGEITIHHNLDVRKLPDFFVDLAFKVKGKVDEKFGETREF